MTANYYDHRVKIPKSAFPWSVGHRLKKSRRTDLTYREAKKYYAKIAHCKTRYISQEVPFSILIARVMGSRAKELSAAITAKNPLYELLTRKGCITKYGGGSEITEEIKYK